MAGILAGTVASAAVPAGFIDASTYGYNAADATAALQAAINTGQNVYVPNMGTPWVITPVALGKSNQTIQFQPGTVVEAKKGSFLGSSDSLFTATGVSNVKMIGNGATLKMNKTDYTQAPYQQGEWRMGIMLISVDQFQIEGFTIKDTGGDGIYVGAWTGSTNFSKDVTIKNVVLDNNYRQGISVISAKNLMIDNAVILNTGGTWPMAGIDFEPNYSNEVLENITVKNSIINANAAEGIIFSAGGLADPSKVSIAVENVTIRGNGFSGIHLYEPLPGVTIKNSLLVSNSTYGLEGTPVTWDLLTGSTPRNSATYSAFWGNSNGRTSGWTTSTGTGNLTNVQPLFQSTDPNSPYYMYLAPNIDSRIATGADDGGYMGARPVYVVPEPAALSLLGPCMLLLLCRRTASETSIQRKLGFV